MAIQDRNLSIGTQLYARYKGQTYTAEVVEKEGAALYRLSDGREFKSPSAAGTAITEKACNGWAFWSVGDGSENSGPVTSTKTRPPTKATITPAPKPQSKRRGRKGQSAAAPASDGSETADEPPAGADQGGDEARDDAPRAAQPDDQPVRCAICGETFPGVEAVTEHYYATHGKPEAEPAE
jgi:hypothetical protein